MSWRFVVFSILLILDELYTYTFFNEPNRVNFCSVSVASILIALRIKKECKKVVFFLSYNLTGQQKIVIELINLRFGWLKKKAFDLPSLEFFFRTT